MIDSKPSWNSRVLFFNAIMETKSKGQKPDADYLWNTAKLYNLDYPQISDGDRKLRKLIKCSSLPMNAAVDLRTMKIVYSGCGFNKSKIESGIKSALGL